MENLLSNFNVTVKVPVLWGDMDAARHVNNTAYLRWTETARIAYFKAANGDNVEFDKIGLILGWQDCKYIFPMTYPDTALLGIKTTEILDDRFLLETHIYSQQHKRLAAISKQVLIAFDYQALEKAPLPLQWVEGIKLLESGTR